MTRIHSPYNLIPGDRAEYADHRLGASTSPYSCLSPFLSDKRSLNGVPLERLVGQHQWKRAT